MKIWRRKLRWVFNQDMNKYHEKTWYSNNFAPI